jgi:zinc/manganese transport system ATP-binding protein
MRAAAPAIDLVGARLELGGRAILSGITLSIEAEEFIGVLGPNGAGKTTLMRAILGLVPAAAGEIRVLGSPARRGNPAVGYMPQTRSNPAIGRISGRDFVASAAGGHRWGLPLLGAEGRREVARVLDLVDGAGLARRPLSEISGGERQRLLLAQALLGQPRLLLLDEPLISLDPHHQHGVVALVRQLQTELGIAVLFSAHELNPLMGAMDRVLYLGSGQAAIGPVDDVITGPMLSRLYGAPIEVARFGHRIFVMAADGSEAEIGCHHHAHG